MRRSKAEVYLHLIWATKNREPLLIGARERIAHRCIEAEARKLNVEVLAIGGMPDHVHLVVKTPTTVSPSLLAKQVKGVSSLAATEIFAWQEGYGVFSISRADVTRVIQYVENQAQHHASHTLWPECEEDGEDVPEAIWFPPLDAVIAPRFTIRRPIRRVFQCPEPNSRNRPVMAPRGGMRTRRLMARPEDAWPQAPLPGISYARTQCPERREPGAPYRKLRLFPLIAIRPEPSS